MSQRTWTPSEIGARIEQVVGERMAASFWVRGEIADLGRSARGMAFLTLVETDDTGRVVARLPGTLRPGKARLVDRRMARVGQPLTEGIEIRLRGHLEYFTPGGRLSLAVDDVDPAHTAGAMALARRALLQRLQQDGLMTANAGRRLPRLPLRVGLVTKSNSQAYHDLVSELQAARYPVAITLVSSSVQGIHAPAELKAALRTLGKRDDLDLILLCRGGGAEVDLATFDDPGVARAVAGSPVQVWTGIGHHLDQPVCELLAARAFKTPTALAQGLVRHLDQTVQAIEICWGDIASTATSHLTRASGRLDAAEARMERAGTSVLARTRAGLDSTANLIDAYDPARMLALGWSVTTTQNGTLVTAPMDIGTRLLTTTRGGTLTSEVTEEP